MPARSRTRKFQLNWNCACLPWLLDTTKSEKSCSACPLSTCTSPTWDSGGGTNSRQCNEYTAVRDGFIGGLWCILPFNNVTHWYRSRLGSTDTRNTAWPLTVLFFIIWCICSNYVNVHCKFDGWFQIIYLFPNPRALLRRAIESENLQSSSLVLTGF